MKYLLLCAVISIAGGPIARVNWLLGTWSGGKPGRQTLETWVKLNDSTFQGKGQMIRGADTVLQESVSLEQRHGQLYYVPTVVGQNSGLPVRFALTSITDSQAVFENPAHDFPQKVTYTRVTPDSLVAEIAGNLQGAWKSRRFPMKRLP